MNHCRLDGASQQDNDKQIQRRKLSELAPAQPFYPAGAYHQQYFRQHPLQSYCAFVVAPKLDKFRKTYQQHLK
jgi:peptide methionine sulfoxide reductase MsrA